MSRDIAAIL